MSATVTLGRLVPVGLREAWPNEAVNFTPWLAQDEHLALLGEALGLELEHEATEKAVGPFAADILAKEQQTGRWVLIENQLEQTDHRHLGQILTYAAGLDAHIVVWVAQSFTEEHRAAIDFLNRATTSEFAFFAVQLQLFRIGASDPAPTFAVLAKPNNWAKRGQAIRQAAEDSETPVQALTRAYWAELIAKAAGRYPALASRSPYKSGQQAGESLRKGNDLYSDVWAWFLGGKRLAAAVWLGGPRAKAAFAMLKARRSEFEAAFGATLDWEELPTHQGCRISYAMPGVQQREHRARWPEQHEWLLAHLPRMGSTFKDAIGSLDVSVIELVDEPQLSEAA